MPSISRSKAEAVEAQTADVPRRHPPSGSRDADVCRHPCTAHATESRITSALQLGARSERGSGSRVNRRRRSPIEAALATFGLKSETLSGMCSDARNGRSNSSSEGAWPAAAPVLAPAVAGGRGIRVRDRVGGEPIQTVPGADGSRAMCHGCAIPPDGHGTRSSTRALTCGNRPTSERERVTRIELAFSAWEADVLPLNYTRRTEPGPVMSPGSQSILRDRSWAAEVDVRRPAVARPWVAGAPAG